MNISYDMVESKSIYTPMRKAHDFKEANPNEKAEYEEIFKSHFMHSDGRSALADEYKSQ